MTTNKTLSNILLIVSVETGISEEDIKGKKKGKNKSV